MVLIILTMRRNSIFISSLSSHRAMATKWNYITHGKGYYQVIYFFLLYNHVERERECNVIIFTIQIAAFYIFLFTGNFKEEEDGLGYNDTKYIVAGQWTFIRCDIFKGKFIKQVKTFSLSVDCWFIIYKRRNKIVEEMYKSVEWNERNGRSSTHKGRVLYLLMLIKRKRYK
jgi:hypothetical protein